MRELGATAAGWLHDRIQANELGRAKANELGRAKANELGRAQAIEHELISANETAAETATETVRQTDRARRRVLTTQLVVRRSCGTHSPEVQTP
jgi:hypothetical protein